MSTRCLQVKTCLLRFIYQMGKLIKCPQLISVWQISNRKERNKTKQTISHPLPTNFSNYHLSFIWLVGVTLQNQNNIELISSWQNFLKIPLIKLYKTNCFYYSLLDRKAQVSRQVCILHMILNFIQYFLCIIIHLKLLY